MKNYLFFGFLVVSILFLVETVKGDTINLFLLGGQTTVPLLQKEIKTVKVTYSTVTGIGQEKGVSRRDPSDVIKVDGLFYVWYSKGPLKTGYKATIWYATSPNGNNWTEQGMALAKGKSGSWEAGSVFTPNIMIAEDRYWLFYTGVSTVYGKGFNPDSKIGIAVSDSPKGPWERLSTNPVLSNSKDPEAFDSHLIDDACLLVREGKYWCYYKGRKLKESPHYTKMGVAISDNPEGPYVKYKGNPVILGNHAILAWPQEKGVAAMIGSTGPPELVRSILFSKDGLHFEKTHTIENGPDAGGGYRSDNFNASGSADPVTWGLEIESKRGSLPFLQRYDVVWPK